MIEPSGQEPIGQKMLYLIQAQVYDEDTGGQLPASSLQFNHQMPGVPAIDVTNDAGAVWTEFIAYGAAGANLETTPVPPRPNISFNPQWPATNVALQIIDLNNNSNVLSGQTNMVIVGQQMNLGVQLSITNAVLKNSMLTNFQWTVPGYAISNYVVAPDTTSAMVVTNFPTTNPTNVFYWVDGATNWVDGINNRIVRVTATISGATVTGQAVFNVLRPMAKIIDQTSSVELGSNVIDKVYGVCFGTNGQFGILFSNTFTMPSGTNYNYGNTNYQINWFQVIIPPYLAMFEFTDQTTTVSISNVVLDTTFPYGFDSRLPFPDADDSPYIGTTAPGEIAASLQQNSEMWLMFQPTNGIWVPLRKVAWNCSGMATNSNSGWVITSRSWSTNPPDMDPGMEYPTWTNNYVDYLPPD